ncbi:MAG TPA: MvdC family ATP-grasp ribosomal peptide maturase, partial [Blastocatellia bacterium]|nr:MvdC family ATP-grasp ribosomal peptide maturase [Blastocatellia bacterium]
MADTVLILTHTADHFTIDRVAAALEHLGARSIRFDTDLFPLEAKLSVRIDSRGLRHSLTHRSTTIGADEVCAIWMRKLWTPRMDESLDEQYRTMCVSESAAMLRGFLDGFQEVVWVNDPICELAAEIKMRQLRVASKVGLKVPRTLNTNDPKEARTFYDELGGQMVTKLLRPLSFSMGAAPVFMYTSEVRAEDLADAEMLRHSPMVFQETIPKSEE